MSKLSFRARALDASKPLPIYHARDVPDLSDYQAINRTVPQMPTGMEKEEETERHLQEVILAQQTNCHHDVFIPTPEVATDVEHYEEVYQKVQNRHSPYIRVPGLGLEEEVPDYDLDSEDEEWLNAQTKERPLSPLHFERMMDKLERGSGNTVLSVRDAQSLLKDEEDLVIAVYDYWLAKRLRLGRALIPAVKHERRDGTSSSNPYLAFRKRTEKMQTRKNRKNDEAAYMQMLKLKRDLSKAKNLAEYMLERENKKQHLAKAEAEIFRQRYQLEDWSGTIMSSLRPVSTQSDSGARNASSVGDGWDCKPSLVKMEGDDQVQMIGRQPVLLSSGLKRRSKKKKFYFPSGTPEPESVILATPEKPPKEVVQTAAFEKSDDEEADGIFTFRRKPHIRYHQVLDDSDSVNWDWVPLRVPASRKRFRYCRTAFGGTYIGTARRRVGRGGRVMWDRADGSENEAEDEEDEEEPLASTAAVTENRDNDIIDPWLKRCRFISRSPSPSSNFEFQSLPLIENPDPSMPPTDPVTSMAIFEFGGFTSDSELPEDASSFSALPTSQFALKPSSSDVECENSSQDEPMDSSGPPPALSLLDRNNGHQAGLRDLTTVLSDRSAQLVDKTRNDVMNFQGDSTRSTLAPPQPTNSLTLKPPPTEHIRKQQPPSHQSSPTPSTPFQISSRPPTTKTPVLIPTPSSMPVTSLTTSSLPKRVPVPSLETNRPTASTDTPRTLQNSLPPKTGPSVKNCVLPSHATAEHSQSGPVDLRNKCDSRQQIASQASVTQRVPPAQQTPTVSSGSSSGGGDGGSGSVPDSNLKSDRTSPTENGLTNAQSVSNPKNESSADTPSPTPPLSLQMSWLTDGPSSAVLLLNSRKTPCSSPSARPEKKEMTDASAITSQFLQHSGGREESGGGATVRVSEQLPTLQATRPMPLALNRDLQLSIVQGTVPMTSSRLPSSLPPTPITPKIEGHPQIFDKRTVSAQNLVARRASTTTNGSNYPEIFHTARRYSDTSERGLKQALAGINHNSLLDTAANSLVQPRANPSEVT